jgi:hypothetical protein
MRIEFGARTSRLAVFTLEGDGVRPAFECALDEAAGSCPAARLLER